LIKAADTIAAYLKCQAELKAGNREFEKAAEEIKRRLSAYELPEVDYFMTTFAPSYQLTLDELLLRRGKNGELSEHEKELLTTQSCSLSPFDRAELVPPSSFAADFVQRAI